MWVFRGGPRERPGILFEYHPTRAGEVAASFLKGYKGVVWTDGYSGYGFLDTTKGIIPMGCWAHVRHKFLDVVKAAGKPKNGKIKEGHTDQALKYIRKLYKIEKDAKKQNEFERWLDLGREDVPPKSMLGKAVTYALNQWSRLTVYADNHQVTMDNNMAENTIRPFAIGQIKNSRKSAVFL